MPLSGGQLQTFCHTEMRNIPIGSRTIDIADFLDYLNTFLETMPRILKTVNTNR